MGKTRSRNTQNCASCEKPISPKARTGYCRSCVKRHQKGMHYAPVPDPTRAEIEERKAQIRAEWTPEERYSRSGYRDMEAYYEALEAGKAMHDYPRPVSWEPTLCREHSG